ncbi:MAG: hypothetical protein AMK75_00970 [Planctomycetes bacterium SM23_65]|nr:MAG: hypothetical protein AMK75_00970 [Planctomycetes bacterium SM23_65]
MTDRVLSELRRMEKEAETRTRVAEGREPMKTPAPGPAAKPSRQEGEQRAARAGQDAQKDLARRPGRDDLKKTLLEDALKEQAEEKKLVYLRIYLKQPRARSVPAASTAPASK